MARKKASSPVHLCSRCEREIISGEEEKKLKKGDKSSSSREKDKDEEDPEAGS